MLTICDYENNEYPLLAVKTVTEDLNSNPVLELKIPKQNNLDVKLIDKLWEINYQTVDYKIMYVKQITKGDSFYLDVRAIPLFYWDFDKQIVHENKDGHYTGTNAFTDLFNGTGYQYVLVDFVEAIQIEGFGKGETRLEMFKRLIERFGLEFYIVGKTVYLKKLIGNDTNFQYRYKLNASNVSKSIDASNYFTHIKGFGNFEEGSENYLSDAKLQREYTSPLATIVGVYEGKPIVDGRIKDTKTMDSNLKRAVEESLEISIEGNLHDVRSIYAEAVPTIGDRVFLIDERIGLEQEIRIHTLKRTYDINDKLIDCEVIFGSQNIRDRYKSNLNSAAKNFTALMKGDIKLPTWSLDEIARGMITKIHASENELRYGDFGIQAVDKNNPNNVFGLNSQGWYISTDGGATARTIATAEGIVADSVTVGTLRGIIIEGVEIYGSKFISDVGDNKTEIEGGRFESTGHYTWTWDEVVKQYNSTVRVFNGYMNIRDDDLNQNLFYTQKGISTFNDGDQNLSSGTLEFFSYDYDPVRKGVTLSSVGGVVGLRSSLDKVILDALDDVYLWSGNKSIKIQPRRELSGNNTFSFQIFNGATSADNDGLLFYGSENNPWSVGLRFSKKDGVNTVYITDGKGNIGQGNLVTKDLRVSGTVTGTTAMDAANIGEILLGSLRTRTPSTNTYFGVGSGILRITNNQLYNGGDIAYREIQALDFIKPSLEKYKEEIIEWNESILDVFRNDIKLHKFKYNYDPTRKINRGIVIYDDESKNNYPPEWRKGDGYSETEVTWWNTKAIQELVFENDDLKNRIKILEEMIA